VKIEKPGFAEETGFLDIFTVGGTLQAMNGYNGGFGRVVRTFTGPVGTDRPADGPKNRQFPFLDEFPTVG